MALSLIFLAISGVLVALTLYIARSEFALNMSEMAPASGSGLFGRIKKTDVYSFPVFVDARAPFAALFVKMDTYMARAIVALHGFVGGVIAIRRFAKVLPAVVIADAVAMVDLVKRHFPRHVKPCETMGTIPHSTANLDLTVSRGGPIAGFFARKGHIETAPRIPSFAPCKDAGGRFVVKNRTQGLGGQIGAVVGFHALFNWRGFNWGNNGYHVYNLL